MRDIPQFIQIQATSALDQTQAAAIEWLAAASDEDVLDMANRLEAGMERFPINSPAGQLFAFTMIGFLSTVKTYLDRQAEEKENE